MFDFARMDFAGGGGVTTMCSNTIPGCGTADRVDVGDVNEAFAHADVVAAFAVIGVALFTTGVVKNREYLRIMVWVIALSFGFYGVKNGLAAILSGGSLVIIQGPGGMLSDNNDFALALCMSIPMLLHLGKSERREHLRRFGQVL